MLEIYRLTGVTFAPSFQRRLQHRIFDDRSDQHFLFERAAQHVFQQALMLAAFKAALQIIRRPAQDDGVVLDMGNVAVLQQRFGRNAARLDTAQNSIPRRQHLLKRRKTEVASCDTVGGASCAAAFGDAGLAAG